MKREEKITEQLSRDMNNLREMDRRNFMKRIGGGLVIAFSVTDMPLLAGCSPQEDEKRDVNAYLKIGEAGRVTLYTGKVEMGQGPITSLPMMLADELDVAIESVDIIMGDTDICPYDEGTYGSLSTRAFGQVLRATAAEARAILLKMAAGELSTDPNQLQVSNGLVSTISDPAKQVSYAELTKGKAILETVKEKPELKKAAEMKIMGSSRLHVDAELKVTGQAKYSGDIQLPGMMYAKIVRPPSLGAKLISVDTSAAEAIEGVEIVREEDFIVLLHASQDTADYAITRVKTEFEEEIMEVDNDTLHEYLGKNGTEIREIGSGGDPDADIDASGTLFVSEFKDPYIAHAPIENHTATAVFEGDKLNIWASCQTPYSTKEDVAEALGIPQEKVRLNEIFTGGAFGGKIYNPQAIEVARIAKLSEKPIQLVYSREEEFLYDRLRPAALVKIKSGITADGEMVLWDYNIYFGGRRGAKHFYDIPNHRTRNLNPSGESKGHPFYTGAWRAPSNNTNTWARESQIEIMASAAGKDPLQFRLDHLAENQKMTKVLEAGAEKFGWTPAVGPSGRGYGLACGIDAGTYVVVFVEAEVNKSTGHVQVKRAVVSQDLGLVVNPQGVIIQAEGCVIMGLGYTLSEEIEFEGRKMLTRNFDTYTLPQFSWTPQIDVVNIDKQDEPPQGGGEPAIICMGGAVANAIFDATGARLYQLPMTPERVLEAIRAT
ncbi:MAG TPA: xanthine dehydrogenase family protein molybdopterin-binding subunit [Bacteroides sp.]|nr:xanthine dehydrogenase family protein molybdopterin-binding subunit [Bacteroides sp.]